MTTLKLVRGASRLAVTATVEVTGVVEDVHVTIASGPAMLGRPFRVPARAFTVGIYATIRAITRLVGTTVDATLDRVPDFGGGDAEQLTAIVNGVVGDHLVETGNPLAIPMTLRSGGRELVVERQALRAAFPQGGPLVVFVHGSCMSDRDWGGDQGYGGILAREHGFSPVYLRYNTGLHISTNGRALSMALEALVSALPGPLVIVGFSMGGLVARSACHVAETEGHSWRSSLRKLVCIGTPHHGSPVERGGNQLHALLGISAYSAPIARLARLRSAGVTDLRHGYVLDEHWTGRDRFDHGDARLALSLPEGVDCYSIVGTSAAVPAAFLPGDGLVPVDSGLGRHPDSALCLRFPEENTLVVYATRHVGLLRHPAVAAKLAAWLSRAVSC